MKEVFAMLEHCLPGHTRRKTDHHWQIRYEGRVYPTFPLGRHGRRENVDVQTGHVRRLVRFFDIADCAKERLPNIG